MQNVCSLDDKVQCLKFNNPSVNNSNNDSKKMSKIKRLYGKSKSPSDHLHKFMQSHLKEGVVVRTSPCARSPMNNMDHSVNQFQNYNLLNASSSSALNIPNYVNQRSRHHNSVKYSNSQNLSSRAKEKPVKTKKKVVSYQKFPECKSAKIVQRSPNAHYEIIAKNSSMKQVSTLNSSKFSGQQYTGGSQPRKQFSLNPKIVSQPKENVKTKSNSRERTHLSQERIIKRENGK